MRKMLMICALLCALCLALGALAEGDAGQEAEQSKEREIDLLTVDHRLYELGYRDGACNGVLDEITVNALKNFQKVNGLNVTGEADDATVELLLNGKAVSQTEYLENLAQENAEVLPLADGSHGEAVTKLQRALKALGYYKGGSDGTFGEETQAAVYRFQLANGLQETGIADSAVQLRLYAETPVAWEEFLEESCASVGDVGARVRTLQIWLEHKGYFKGECTGRYGDGTQQAVRRFQTDQSLEPSGDLDLNTCGALYWNVDVLLRDSAALRRGDTGTAAEALCQNLALLGYPAHARFNMQTELALMQFQLVNKLEVTGIADEVTRARLYSEHAVRLEDYESSGGTSPKDENISNKLYRLATSLLGQSSELDTDFGFVQYTALKCGLKLMERSQLAEIELERADGFEAGAILSVEAEGRKFCGIGTSDGAVIYRAESGYIVMSYLEAMELERVCLLKMEEEA